ncbi:MAG: bifunctional oligoribonuclease/PAP phosphatase NrnA [Candidatus Peregrinibacteria bacterium]|nr:bifunctional oligoribonuclease/PAP phosphatase NrnA [Candidatus Peregrinibacteria bacterium]
MTNNSEIIDKSELKNFKEYLATKPKIIVLVAANIDADAIGGSLALYNSLVAEGFDIDIACHIDIPEKYHFLDGVEKIKKDFNENDFDCTIITDCGNIKMIGFQEEKPKLLTDEIVKINIDHHASNNNYGKINFVTEAPSATIIVFRLLQKLNFKITPQIATSLLAGIYGDTGSFMHQNTTPECYATSAELVKLGANTNKISKNIFQSYELKTFKLWGKVLQNLHVTSEGAAIVGIKKNDYESIGATREDLEGVINFVNSMPEAKYSVMLSEDEKGNVKASLRTRNPEIDVKALAEKFGGGGHVKAAGFTIPDGHLQKEVKWKIVTE